MDRCADYALAYAKALAAAGADMLSGGDSPAGLIGPRLYREVALPAEQRVIAGLKAHASLLISLHICGRATTTALWGNLDPVVVLARGSREQVCAATDRVLRTVAAHGRLRFVLSSGCTLSVDTPSANLAAMRQRARHWPPLGPESPLSGGAVAGGG